MSQLLTHYAFTTHPFGRAVNADTLYHHPGFDEAYSRLRFTADLHGMGMLVAESGCGKSVLLGQLAADLQREGWTVHYFAHSSVGPFGLVNVLARKVGATPRRSRAETASLLTQILLDSQKNHLLVVDEAHALPDATIEDVRLLTIADFDRKSPFILVLSGQPLLDDRLADPTHHALDQRITSVARLAPLSLTETRDYVARRLEAAGSKKTPTFEDDAVEALFDASGGIPRAINNLATSALIVAAARKRRIVTQQDVQDARLDRARP